MFSLFPEEDVSGKHFFNNLDSHITDAMPWGVEVITCGFLNFFPVDISSVFTKSVLQWSISLTYILFTTMITRNTVNYIRGVTCHCCVHFYCHIGCMWLDYLPWDWVGAGDTGDICALLESYLCSWSSKNWWCNSSFDDHFPDVFVPPECYQWWLGEHLSQVVVIGHHWPVVSVDNGWDWGQPGIIQDREHRSVIGPGFHYLLQCLFSLDENIYI